MSANSTRWFCSIAPDNLSVLDKVRFIKLGMWETFFFFFFFSSSSSSLAYGPYSLTSTSFIMIVRTDLTSAFSLHISIPIDFRHCQYSLATLILVWFFCFSFSTWLPQKYIFLRYYHQTLLPDDQPILVFFFLCRYNIWFTIHNLQYIINSDSPAVLICYGLYIFLSIFRSLVSRDDFIAVTVGGGKGVVIFKLGARNSFPERN
jgi:hypothetical protein